jgi:hypothetical protein
MGENLCQLYICQGINNQKTQRAEKVTLEKNNNPSHKWAKELNRQLSKEEGLMAKKYMKKFSTSLAIKGMQIKTALRFYLTQVRMAVVNNIKATNVAKDGQEGKEPFYTIGGNVS